MRNVSAVVDVGMGEQQSVDLVGRDGEGAVALLCFVATTLKEPAIQRDDFIMSANQVHRPGDGVNGAVEHDRGLVHFTKLFVRLGGIFHAVSFVNG